MSTNFYFDVSPITASNFVLSSGKTRHQQDNDNQSEDHYESPSSYHYVKQDLYINHVVICINNFSK